MVTSKSRLSNSAFFRVLFFVYKTHSLCRFDTVSIPLRRYSKFIACAAFPNIHFISVDELCKFMFCFGRVIYKTGKIETSGQTGYAPLFLLEVFYSFIFIPEFQLLGYKSGFARFLFYRSQLCSEPRQPDHWGSRKLN